MLLELFSILKAVYNYSILQLLYGLMLPSGNDAAIVVA